MRSSRAQHQEELQQLRQSSGGDQAKARQVEAAERSRRCASRGGDPVVRLQLETAESASGGRRRAGGAAGTGGGG